MNSASTDIELAEPYLLGWLSTVTLDVEYVRAEGNTLYRLDEEGHEVAVLDMAGGYGSLMFGHNHPDLVAYAKALLDAQTPIHAQFSRHPYANDVAVAVSRIIRRELGVDEQYSAIFANSGAEAVEAAIKHAELDRVLKVTSLREKVTSSIELARAAIRSGATVVPGPLHELVDGTGHDSTEAAFDELVAAVERHNEEQFSRPPLLFALENSFHGKLAGSVQLTHNPGYRTPFAALGRQAEFVPADQPHILKERFEAARGVVFDFAVADGQIRTVTHDTPVLCAFLVEPIQGEGGINVLTREAAQEFQDACRAAGCPIIVDEVQTGLGRTGAFLASSHIGLQGDYFAFAKSLGGGLAKAALMVVRQDRYRPEFELVHSSTFAKDSFSCHLAKKVLEMLEADDGQAYRQAAEQGGRLRTMLESVREDFPGVVKEVRGRGLMLGMEFADQSDAPSGDVREAARSGVFGYVLAGYLLREHNIRTFPTASAVNTLRFEPSLYLTDEEILRLESALRAACRQMLCPTGRLNPSAGYRG